METENKEKFKTIIGGQALIEGIMMRGPKLDAIVTRNAEGIHVETTPRKIPPKGSIKTWPLIRGAVNFFDAQVTGVKALMHSADLSPEESQAEPSKLDQWLEKKLGDKKFQNLVISVAVFFGLAMSIALFFVLPELLGMVFERWIHNTLLQELLRGVIRILIFVAYLLLVSRMKEMKRVFSYHGAEHKTIRCYEAGLPLTVENVRVQTRKHPRCGTSFLLVVMILAILIFSLGSQSLLKIAYLAQLKESSPIAFKLIMIVFRLLLLPLVVAVGYELNRVIGRHDNWFTRILTAPGQWFQNFTTFEPDDDMIEVGIAALQAVIPEEEGTDRW